MILRLTDGTNTTNLVGGPIYRADYVPRTPEMSVVEYEPATVLDGGEAASITRRNVTEQCDVTISADTMAEVEAALHEIEAFFLRAVEFQNRRGGSRVYVELATDGSTVYRSEILYGRVELGEQPLMWLASGPALSAALIWRRRFYWEASDEVTLALTNTYGTGSSGVIYNHLTAVFENYVAIDGADVDGVLPTPARIEITNTYATDILANVIVGHNVYADPDDLVPELECEGALTDVGAVYTDVTCAGGEYVLLNMAATRELLLTWTISSEVLSSCRGRFFRLWLRCQDKPAADTYLTPKMILGIGTLQVVAEGQETKLNTGQVLQDLGVLQIPPYLMGDTGVLFQMDLALYGRSASLGTLAVDFLYLMPLDGYRELRPRGYGMAQDITLVDDGIADSIWVQGYGIGSDELIGLYYGLGPRVTLIPDRDQRLYFLMSNTDGDAEIERTATVVVKYRPRRLTV